MADPSPDDRNPNTPFHAQDGKLEVASAPEPTSRNYGALAVFAIFVLVLVAGGFVFAFGGFGGRNAVDKPAPGVGFSPDHGGAQPHGPNGLATPPNTH